MNIFAKTYKIAILHLTEPFNLSKFIKVQTDYYKAFYNIHPF